MGKNICIFLLFFTETEVSILVFREIVPDFFWESLKIINKNF